MKKYLVTFFLMVLSALLIISSGCAVRATPPEEINQWDYFNPSAFCSRYEYLEEPPRDLSRRNIHNSAGEIQLNCWGVYSTIDEAFLNLGDSALQSDLDYYSYLRISPKAAVREVTLTQVSLMITAEADCQMYFSLTFGLDSPSEYEKVNAVANTATELKFERFLYDFTKNPESDFYIMLENPSSIGNIKYSFSNLKLTLRKNA